MNKTLVCIFGLVLAAPVYAATTAEPAPMDSIGKSRAMSSSSMYEMMMQRFNQSDADHNGSLTKQEAESNMPMLVQHFDEIDTNHNAQVSREEMQAAFAQRMQSQNSTGIVAK